MAYKTVSLDSQLSIEKKKAGKVSIFLTEFRNEFCSHSCHITLAINNVNGKKIMWEIELLLNNIMDGSCNLVSYCIPSSWSNEFY